MTRQELGAKTGKALCNVLQSLQEAQALIFEYDKQSVDNATASMFERLIYGLADEYTSIINKIDVYSDVAPLLTDKIRASFAEFYNAFTINLGKFGYENHWAGTFKLID